MTSKNIWALLCTPFLLTTLIMLSGCGSSSGNVTPPQTPTPEFLYTVTSAGSPPNLTSQLSSYKVNTSTGALTATSTMPWPQSNDWIAVDPASRFLYSPTPSAYGFVIYSLDPATGAPISAGGFLLNSGICGLGCVPPSAPGALAITPDGKFMYYGSSSFGGVTEAVGALNVDNVTGQLSVVNGSPFFQVPMPFVVLVHPSGKFVYTENINTSVVGGFTLNSVSGFSIDASGALTAVPNSPVPAPAAASVVGFAIHPSGKFLYAATELAANGVLAWSVDPMTGALATLSGSPFAPGTTSFGGTFDPAGKFFYVSVWAGSYPVWTILVCGRFEEQCHRGICRKQYRRAYRSEQSNLGWRASGTIDSRESTIS